MSAAPSAERWTTEEVRIRRMDDRLPAAWLNPDSGAGARRFYTGLYRLLIGSARESRWCKVGPVGRAEHRAREEPAWSRDPVSSLCSSLVGACAGIGLSRRKPRLPTRSSLEPALSGLSAAIEMGRGGVSVLVIDMNSVAGGHAVLAGGVALVGTPVQEKAGVKDSPDLAYKDWTEWTGDGDPAWTRYYAEHSRSMIYDWVTAMGVEFVRAGAANGNSVPRFHFTKGRALHLVMPMFKTALALPNVSFLWNARAERLVVEQGVVRGVVVRHLRTGRTETLRAAHTVLATGGFESDLDRVLGNWTPGLPRPDRLLIGSAISATGSGHDMATDAGAALSRIDRHYIYIDGLPDPRDPEGIHALTGGNGRSMWVNAQGRRFTNESGWDKQILVDTAEPEAVELLGRVRRDGARGIRCSRRGVAEHADGRASHPRQSQGRAQGAEPRGAGDDGGTAG